MIEITLADRIADELEYGMGHTPERARAMAEIMVREDITFDEKQELIDHLLGRYGTDQVGG